MNTASLTLIFLAPLIVIATYFLLEESKDPLRGFHDKYRSNVLKLEEQNILGVRNEKENDSRFKIGIFLESKIKVGKTSIKRIHLILFYLSFSFLLLVAEASGKTLLLLAAGLGLFIYWEKGTESRVKKNLALASESQFPSIIELFTVLVSAGESPANALEKISQLGHGVLIDEIRFAIGSLRGGFNLSQCLEQLGLRTESLAVRRFCDSLILASERGTPLFDVLQNQVQEVRQQNHVAMLAAAGKAEIALMIPVIFLILPISVLFALWPSYTSLGIGY